MEYQKALDTYKSPEDVPDEIVRLAAEAAKNLGGSTRLVDVVKARHPVKKFFGMKGGEDDVEVQERPDFRAPRGGAASATYKTDDEVRDAYRRGEITREKAQRLLLRR